MGTLYPAICNDCGTKFEVSEGGGFTFHLLKCSKCGADKSIGFDSLGEIHKRYVKGLSVPYSTATSEEDDYIQKNYRGTPITEQEYHQEIEKTAGNCKCGGQFKFNAPTRCPNCKSANIAHDPDGRMIFYD
jgi:predicted Zn-ribbon and HTH transcriptional regulator